MENSTASDINIAQWDELNSPLLTESRRRGENTWTKMLASYRKLSPISAPPPPPQVIDLSGYKPHTPAWFFTTFWSFKKPVNSNKYLDKNCYSACFEMRFLVRLRAPPNLNPHPRKLISPSKILDDLSRAKAVNASARFIRYLFSSARVVGILWYRGKSVVLYYFYDRQIFRKQYI